MKDYNEKNREAIKQRKHARYWADPVLARDKKKASTSRHLEETRRRCRDWHRANKERQKAYRDETRERYREVWRAWWKRNPVKARARNLRSKAVRRQNERKAGQESFTRTEIYQRDKGVCVHCKQQVGQKWHMDHLLPLSRGGQHTRTNVAVSCIRCNLSKGAKILV